MIIIFIDRIIESWHVLGWVTRASTSQPSQGRISSLSPLLLSPLLLLFPRLPIPWGGQPGPGIPDRAEILIFP